MYRRTFARPDDGQAAVGGDGAWLRATIAVGVVQSAFLIVVSARPGLPAVILWYVVPPLVALAAAVLLAAAFFRSWRHRGLPPPRQLMALAALALVIATLVVVRTYPSSFDDRPSQVRFRLPLDGPVTVAWGGDTLAVNYHGVMPDQRWAFDLLVTADGKSFRGDGSRLEDYYAFGRPVLSPASGIVRVVQDQEVDGPIGQWRVRRVAGNHVVLEVAEDQFLFIAHLQQGSIAVGPGERVAAGQLLGRVGNSGNSSEPHVHLHLQSTPMAYLGEGIPFYFHDYRTQGRTVARGMPSGGRERRSRALPGAFVGDVVEQIGSTPDAGGGA